MDQQPPLTLAAFRQGFPEFMDPSCYPDHEVSFWLRLGTKLMDPSRWCELMPEGLSLFVAHNLAIQNPNKRSGARGQQPGQVVGATTAASVDKVSYSRDPGAAMDPANGHWNLTNYGIRYKWLVNIVGAGPQISKPAWTGDSALLGWPGVLPTQWG